MSQIRVLIVDDHSLVRQGLKKVLELEDDIKVVGEAEDGQKALEMAKTTKPDVVLMDISMPNMNGIEATRAFKQQGFKCAILVLTIHDDREYLFEIVRAGASGYVLKDIEPQKLVEAIRAVGKGNSYIQPNLTLDLISEFNRLSSRTKLLRENPLTRREMEVLQLITEGMTNAEIASELYISEKTVKNHVSRILRKLNVEDRTQAAVFAIKNDLV
jgi:DNA-binding NarL/FixJ family response regulator